MKVLIIYEELDWVFKAGSILIHAAQNAGVSTSWEPKPWRADILKFAGASDKALVEALHADFIVFAGVQLDSLAAWFGEWLERWVIRREIEDVALVVMNHRNSEGQVVGFQSWLSRFAANHRLGFIEE